MRPDDASGPILDDLSRSLLDSVDQGLVVTDAELRVVGWNGAMERLTGLSRQEAQGRPVTGLLAVLGDLDLAPHLRRALAGDVVATGEIAYSAPGRAYRGWLEARCLPWSVPGRVAGVLVFLADMTEARRRAVFMRAIEAIGHSLGSSLDLNEVLDTIVGKAQEVMGADSALVAGWDGRAPEFTVLRVAGRLSADYPAAGTIPIGGGPMSRAVLQGRPVKTRNILTDSHLWLEPKRRTQIGREGFKAVAAAPLASKGRIHGALVVHYWVEREVSDEEMAALALLAEQAALAIENARVYADATRRADRLRELAEVEQLVAGSLDLDDVLKRIVEATARLVGAPVAQVYTADPVARVLRLRASSAEVGDREARLPATIAFGEGISGRAAESKLPFYVSDVTQAARALSAQWARDSGILRLLVVPLIAGDDVLGVLTVRSRTDSLSNDENRALITSLAAQAAVAIQNARTYTDAVRRAGRLRDLVAVSQSISASLEPTDVMERIAAAAAGMRQGAQAAVHVLDPARNVLRYAANFGLAWRELPAEIPANAGLPGLVLTERRPVLVADPGHHPRTLVPGWWAARPGASFYGVPIVSGETLVGVLDYVVSDGTPDPEEQEALLLLAAHAGVALQNARLYREAQRRHEVAEVLARLGRELTATLDVERIGELVARGLTDLLDVRATSVWRCDPEDGALRVITAFGIAGESLRGVTLGPGEGAVGRAVAERKLIVTHDVLNDPSILVPTAFRTRIEPEAARAVAAAPLVTGERVLGAIAVGAETGRDFAADELQAFQAFADQAALAFENARLYASARDSLGRLRDTQAQLVQAAKLSALGQLVSGVAHELNNPLSVIIGYGQLLLSRDVPPAVHRPIELMVAQADRMAKIVRNLLYFARQRPPERTAVNVNQTIEQTLALRQNQLTLSGIKVVKEFAEDLPLVAADSQQLEQVFLNLLLNAEQAILETKETGRVILRTRVGDGGDTVVAEVVDDGPGIAADVLPRVFEPFFTTKNVGAGTGLGLSVSYGIVQEHGGRLSVESQPGVTVFSVELPIARPGDTRTVEAVVERTAIAGDGRFALVVEDEPTVLDLVVTLLGHTGWRVDVAPGGRSGLARVRERKYDLVVSDMRMPEGGGAEFYRSAVAEDAELARRFVFITGDTANPEAWEFLKGTKAPVVEKPFQPAMFLDAVHRVTSALTPSGSGA